MRFTCQPAGDRAALLLFEQKVSEDINEQVIQLSECIRAAGISGVEELVPAFASLMVYYHPLMISFEELARQIKSLDSTAHKQTDRGKTVHEIPVLYGGEAGPDLPYVADFHNLTTEEVIRIHTEKTYRVYMIGFVPGFPYLGGLDERIHTPRLDTPRLQTPAGSVGIAGQQTGIYPLSTPGGWRIIGRTPTPLFRPDHTERPVLISAGDSIRFTPITEEHYFHLLHTGTPQEEGGISKI